MEDKIQAYYEISRKIAELEQQRKELGQEILKLMTQKTIATAEYTVRKYERFSIKTSLDEARLFQATRTEEIIDKEKLKQLHLAGQPIGGISCVQYIQVHAKKNPESII